MIPSIFRENSEKKEKWEMTKMGRLTPFLLSSFCITLMLSGFFLYHQNPLSNTTDLNILSHKTHHDDEKCDLFEGQWIPDRSGSLYTNSSCPTIPSSKNCIKHGRPDRDFMFWRWKPNACDLPRFNPKLFLSMLRRKKMTFIGDSVARNHLDSLLCLLSTEETPRDVYKDADDRNRIWYFPKHDFTLAASWTKFLVMGRERRDINGTGTGVYDIDIEKIDDRWFNDLPNTDIAIVSSAHWFFRPIVIHKGDQTLGCVFCDFTNMTQISPKDAFKLVFSAVFKNVDECYKCKENLVTVLRTFAPAHFENGTWNNGGACRRTSPFNENQINLQSTDMDIRTSQIEELKSMIKHNGSKKFAFLDVTKAMMMRPDGHPNAYSGNTWMKGFNDCVHWCLPGPIDVWNDLLMAILRRLR